MMSKLLIEAINKRIEDHQDCIDDLVNARRIVEDLMAERPKGPTTTGAKVDTSLDRTRSPHVQKQLINAIYVVLRGVAEPIPSRIIMQEMEAQGTRIPNKQRVWAALAVMKKQGIIVHDKDTGTYILAEKVHHENSSQAG
jgi:hypothetical protein